MYIIILLLSIAEGNEIDKMWIYCEFLCMVQTRIFKYMHLSSKKSLI